MTVVSCPYCKRDLSIEEYRQAISCKHCGQNLASYSRRMQTVFGAIMVLVFLAATYWYFHSRGGWISANASDKEAAVALNLFAVLVIVLYPLLDWAHTRVFKARGGMMPFLATLIVVGILSYSPLGKSLREAILSSLG